VLRERGLRAQDVRSIQVTMEPNGMEPIIHHQPRTGLQGKFSGEYVVAACLLDGQIGLPTFTDQAVSRSEAQDLLRRVTIRESAVPPLGAPTFAHAYATLEVTLRDGSLVRERCDVPRGDARMPLSDSEVEAKFRDSVAFSGTTWDADNLLARLQGLAAMDVVALS
jgi:2-methylcitrate dehydratase PrpD